MAFLMANMTPHALITALEATGLTQAQIGAEVGVTRKQVNSWKHDRAAMPQSARMVLALILTQRVKKKTGE
jgi:transcriptional regulator with XRE-family HTH domain